jgi:hypothetical protein
VACATGWDFEFVTLRQHPEYRNLWGYVQYSRPLESRADLDLWAPTFLAGQFGEVALMGFAGPGGSQDNAMVMEHVRAYLGTGDSARAFFEQAFDQARSRVLGETTALRAVANALIQREQLNRADVDVILGRPEP